MSDYPTGKSDDRDGGAIRPDRRDRRSAVATVLDWDGVADTRCTKDWRNVAVPCQAWLMNIDRSGIQVRHRLIDSLYREALQLSEASRRYFDSHGCLERDRLPSVAQVAVSSASLRVTTRLLHSLAWLLTQRAVMTGDMSEREALDPSRRLPVASISETETTTRLPHAVLELVQASEDLYRRVARLDDGQTRSVPVPSPVHLMRERLAMTF